MTADEERELSLEDEGQACEGVGLRFRSFPIVDRSVPLRSQATTAFLSALRDELLDGRSVVVHCRMGIGRSSLVAAAVLKLLGQDPAVAFAQLARARGRPVPDTAEQRQWVVDFEP